MKEELIIKEKYSKYWPFIAGISAILSVIFFLGYQFVGDVLLEGYLRLTSFAFFALSLLSLFKIRDGQIKISVRKTEDGVIEFIYSVRKQTIYEEEFSNHELENLKLDEMPNKSLYNDFMKSDRCIRFRRKDTSDWLYLNKVHGRVIPLSENNAEKMLTFLKSENES